MIDLSVKSEIDKLCKGLTLLEREQLPFAIAGAVTGIAKRIALAETQGLDATFDRPTPFTERAFGVTPARKHAPVAVVFARNIQARYLEPYVDGGLQVLGAKKGLLNPKAVALNSYGNLPKGLLARLKGRADIFIGPVKTRAGVINGVWQRPGPVIRGRRGANRTGHLRLLIRFGDPQPVKQRLDYRARAEAAVARWAAPEFHVALGRALATATRP